MNIILDEPAKKTLRKLDKATRQKIGQEINKYKAGLRVDIKKIKSSSNDWRLAVDDWRVMMEYDAENKAMHIIAVIHRKDAYR